MGFAKSFIMLPINQIKFLVLNKGLKMVELNSLMPIEISTDSKEVIFMLSNGNLYYNATIDDCKSSLSRLGRPVMQYSYWEQNSIANALVKEEAPSTTYVRTRFFVIPPVYACKLVWVDMLGTMFEIKIIICNEP